MSAYIPSSLPKGAFCFVQVPCLFSRLDYSDPVGRFGCYVGGMSRRRNGMNFWRIFFKLLSYLGEFRAELDSFGRGYFFQIGYLYLENIFIHSLSYCTQEIEREYITRGGRRDANSERGAGSVDPNVPEPEGL